MGDRASGKMRLETVIDSESEDQKALKTVKNKQLHIRGDFVISPID